MGFFSSFFGGFALTTSLLYVTLHFHLANRQYHHALLREQIDLLNTLSLPKTARNGLIRNGAAAEVMARQGYLPRERPGIVELGKERWNQEIKLLVRRAQETKWEDIREKAQRSWEAARSLVKNE